MPSGGDDSGRGSDGGGGLGGGGGNDGGFGGVGGSGGFGGGGGFSEGFGGGVTGNAGAFGGGGFSEGFGGAIGANGGQGFGGSVGGLGGGIDTGRTSSFGQTAFGDFSVAQPPQRGFLSQALSNLADIGISVAVGASPIGALGPAAGLASTGISEGVKEAANPSRASSQSFASRAIGSIAGMLGTAVGGPLAGLAASKAAQAWGARAASLGQIGPAPGVGNQEGAAQSTEAAPEAPTPGLAPASTPAFGGITSTVAQTAYGYAPAQPREG